MIEEKGLVEVTVFLSPREYADLQKHFGAANLRRKFRDLTHIAQEAETPEEMHWLLKAESRSNWKERGEILKWWAENRYRIRGQSN